MVLNDGTLLLVGLAWCWWCYLWRLLLVAVFGMMGLVAHVNSVFLVARTQQPELLDIVSRFTTEYEEMGAKARYFPRLVLDGSGSRIIVCFISRCLSEICDRDQSMTGGRNAAPPRLHLGLPLHEPPCAAYISYYYSHPCDVYIIPFCSSTKCLFVREQ